MAGVPGPFRPASRRTAQATGLCYPRGNFQTRSEESDGDEWRLPGQGSGRHIRFIAIRLMKRPRATAQLRLVLAVAFGVLLASALLRSLRTSGSVMLLLVGYSEEVNGVQLPIFCLTNGTSKPIAYSASSRGTPARRLEVRTATGLLQCEQAGWRSPSETCVLRPGQSVSFVGWSPWSSISWRVGVKHWPCEIRRSQNTTSGNTFLGFDASAGFRDVDARPIPGTVVVCERTLMRRVQAKLPKLTPAWLKRYVDSKAREPVAWSPQMK